MSTKGGLDDGMVKLEAQGLQDLVTAIFAAIGCSTKEAGRIAAYLVGANLAGHDSHGVARVPGLGDRRRGGGPGEQDGDESAAHRAIW